MDRILLTILNMSLTASFVIVVVILARLVLRRTPKVISYALWAVVLFRLLCPITIESTVSLVPFNNKPIQTPVRLDPEQPSIIGAGVTFPAALDAAQRAVGDALNGGLGTIPIYTGSEPNEYIYAFHSEVWIIFGSYLWPVGAAALLLYAIIGYIRLKRRVSLAIRVEGNIFETDKIDSPFVWKRALPGVSKWHPMIIKKGARKWLLFYEQ